MIYIPDVIIGVILGWVFYTDYSENRIPNLAVCGVLLTSCWVHWHQIGSAISSFLAVFILFLPFTLKGAFGAGDLKMSAALSAFAGFAGGIYIFLFGSILALVYYYWKKARMGKLRQSLKAGFASAAFALSGNAEAAASLSSHETIPFGCWLFAGFLLWEVFTHVAL